MTTRNGSSKIELVHEMLASTQKQMQLSNDKIDALRPRLPDLSVKDLGELHHALTNFVSAAGMMKGLMKDHHGCCTFDIKMLDEDILKYVEMIGTVSLLSIITKEEQRRKQEWQ